MKLGLGLGLMLGLGLDLGDSVDVEDEAEVVFAKPLPRNLLNLVYFNS